MKSMYKQTSEECCGNSIAPQKASEWLRQRARAQRDAASRLEKLADACEHLNQEASIAMYELADSN